MADVREQLRQIAEEHGRTYTPARVAALRRYYESLGGAGFDAMEQYRRTHDAPRDEEETLPGSPSWGNTGNGYPL